MTSDNVLRILHKYICRDMAYFLDLFDREFLDDAGEPSILFKRTNNVFFERIIALLLLYIPHFTKAQLVRTFSILKNESCGQKG